MQADSIAFCAAQEKKHSHTDAFIFLVNLKKKTMNDGDIHQLLSRRFKEILQQGESSTPVLCGGGSDVAVRPAVLIALIVVVLAVSGVVQLKTGLFSPPRRRLRPLPSQLVLIFSCLLYMVPLMHRHRMVSWLAALVGAVSLVYHSAQATLGATAQQALACTSVVVVGGVAATLAVAQRMPIWWSLLWLLPAVLYVVANLPANKESARYGYLQAGVHLLSAGLLTVYAIKT